MTKPFVLVSGDCDETMPFDLFNQQSFDAFINDPRIIHWYCQNWVGKHSKVTLMPIGLDFHTPKSGLDNRTYLSIEEQQLQIDRIQSQSKHFSERIVQCYGNFQFLMNTRYADDRRDAIHKIPSDLIFYEPKRQPVLTTYKNQSEYAFVVSPHGNGYDCHRTWEALCLGCIPIVKTSELDELFSDLPVLIVQDWSEITQHKLLSTVETYKNKKFNYDKLLLSYWTNQIKSHKNKY
jgi:hypothetical protein